MTALRGLIKTKKGWQVNQEQINPHHPMKENMTMTTNRLQRDCDSAIKRLEYVIALLKQLAANDGASPQAAHRLEHESRFIAYEGNALCVPLDGILNEYEEMQADETFGPREPSEAA